MGSVSELPVVFVAFDGVQSIDVAGPYEVFASAGEAAGSLGIRAGYRVRVASAHGGLVRTESGMDLGTERLPGPVGRIDTLVLPGRRPAPGPPAPTRRPGRLVRGRRWSGAAGSRRCARAPSCSPPRGLLDGRRVTTHWASAERAGPPAPDPGGGSPTRSTSATAGSGPRAGVTAGIDLALAMVEEDLGTRGRPDVARWLVMFPQRPGGQVQFAAPASAPRPRAPPSGPSRPWMESASRRRPSACRRSPMRRHERAPLHPGVPAEVGQTPGRFVERRRARGRPPATSRPADDTLEAIAARCGFGIAETLRRVLPRAVSGSARRLPRAASAVHRPTERDPHDRRPAVSPSPSSPASPPSTPSGPTRCWQAARPPTSSSAAAETGRCRTDNGLLGIVGRRHLRRGHRPDVIVVPGGTRQPGPAENDDVVDWLAAAHAGTAWTTSVCTGALLLGAAGMLDGLTATTHWAADDRPRSARCHRPNGSSSTARSSPPPACPPGSTWRCTLVARIDGRDVAEAIQLGIEYDPQPPFDCGSLAEGH